MPEHKIKYAQKQRLLEIKTASSDPELLLESFSGTEAVSTPFEFQISLLCTSDSVDLKSLLRTPATVTLNLADKSERYFHAIFRSLTQAPEGEGAEKVNAASGIATPE